MVNYTTNIAQNPGLQLGLSGFAGLNNASLVETALGQGGALFGNPGLLVTTPGAVSGEGVSTPASTVQSTTAHSASVYIQGTTLPANVTVYVISNPGGTILGSIPIQLTDVYQQAVINNFPATSGNTLSLIVSTTSVESVQFWITNIQIEPEASTTAYCDGGQAGCAWQSTVGGISFRQFQNTILATSAIVDAPNIVSALIIGEPFNITVKTAFDQDSPGLVNRAFAPGPQAALTDFSVASLTDLDPAQSYVSWNNTGLAVPTSGYARSAGMFFPPQDYFVSGNAKLYSRAAFMAVGFQFSNVPNNQKVTMTDVQVEIADMTTGFLAGAPTVYNLPREINTIIKPDRLNYCPNPSFTISIAGWNPVGSGVLVQDPTISANTITTIDDQQETGGTASLSVGVTNAGGDGASIQLTNLIAGDTYIVSAYVQASANVNDIILTCANGTTSVAHGNSGSGYGSGAYGAGFYGGSPPSNTALTTGQWYRIFTTFQPTDSVATLTITAATTAPTNFWVDAVLVEPGEVLGFYFDGSFGNNVYFWEGTPGLSRSYFYDEYFVKAQAVSNVLAHHTPYGISFNPPLFFTPPTQ